MNTVEFLSDLIFSQVAFCCSLFQIVLLAYATDEMEVCVQVYWVLVPDVEVEILRNIPDALEVLVSAPYI